MWHGDYPAEFLAGPLFKSWARGCGFRLPRPLSFLKLNEVDFFLPFVAQGDSLEQLGGTARGSICRRAEAGNPENYVVEANLFTRGNFRASPIPLRTVSEYIGGAGNLVWIRARNFDPFVRRFFQKIRLFNLV